VRAKRGVLFLVGAAAIGAACTDLGGLSGPTAADAGADASDDAATDTAPPPPPPQDAADVDATRIDAGPDATCCDCDNDTYVRDGCDAGPDATIDCDDLNPAIHPGQSFVSAHWDNASPHVPAGDWNCDGVVTKQYAYDFTCAGGPPPLACTGTEGLIGDPECGQTASYETCTNGPVGCKPSAPEIRTQGCR
jgi:hypothetical protein